MLGMREKNMRGRDESERVVEQLVLGITHGIA